MKVVLQIGNVPFEVHTRQQSFWVQEVHQDSSVINQVSDTLTSTYENSDSNQ